MSSEVQERLVDPVEQPGPSTRPRTLGLYSARCARVVLWLGALTAVVACAGGWLRRETRLFDFTEPKLEESLSFRNQRFDVAFFGDSLTLEGVNPSVIDRLLHRRSYNFALGGASILESEMQLRYFLRKNPKPQLVVLGLYVNIPNRPNGVRPTLYFALPPDLRTLYRERLTSSQGFQIDKSFLLFNSLPAYRYRNTIDLVVKSLLSRSDQRPKFVQGQAQVSFSRPVYLGSSHDSVLNTSELESFVEFCRLEELPLLLIEPPNNPGYSEITPNRERILDEIQRIATKGRSTRFVTYNDGMLRFDQGKNGWVNLNHLNVDGSIAFSQLLSMEVERKLAETSMLHPNTSPSERPK